MTWDYRQKEYKKQAKADPIWYLERLINYGLNGEKIKQDDLKKHLVELNIPDDRRAFLELLIWGKKF